MSLIDTAVRAAKSTDSIKKFFDAKQHASVTRWISRSRVEGSGAPRGARGGLPSAWVP